MIYYRIKLKDECHHEKIPLSLIIGGAIGNVIDRILVLIPSSGYNGVIDFIDIGLSHFSGYDRIFNLSGVNIWWTENHVIYNEPDTVFSYRKTDGAIFGDHCF